MTKSTITRERIQRIIRAINSEAYDEEEIRGWLSSDEIMELSRMALAAMDSSESVELPLDYLQGHKDGLEFASQLAEANHPETGDWLYDDPIELAKAIRKGPDMPPAQPVADSEPVAVIDLANLDYLLSGADADVWPPEREEMGDVLLYRHAQPAPVVVPEGLNPETTDLVLRFASALADKLYKAEQKYGRSTDWMKDDWYDDCLQSLWEHIGKGDPRDVAAYCAFMWYHGWETKVAQPSQEEQKSVSDRQAIFALESAGAVTPIGRAYKMKLNACRAAMLQAGTLTNEGTIQAANSPVIPDGYVMVPKGLLSELRDWAHPEIEKYCEMWEGRRDSEFPALRKVITDADELLAAAPQLPGSEPATVPGKWIPVSERMPETDGNYWGWWSESKRQGPVWFIKSELQAQFQSHEITHWMPLPAAPQEVKGE